MRTFKKLCHETVEPGVDLVLVHGLAELHKRPQISMRWEGKLVPTETGKYRFNMKSFGAEASVSGWQGGGA